MPEAGRQRKNLLLSGRRCRRLADNGKINHGKGMLGAAAGAFPFLNISCRGQSNGQKKGGPDHDKGGHTVQKGAGGPEGSLSLRDARRGQETDAGCFP